MGWMILMTSSTGSCLSLRLAMIGGLRARRTQFYRGWSYRRSRLPCPKTDLPADAGFRTRIITYIILCMNARAVVRCPLGAPLVLAVALAAAPGSAQEGTADRSATATRNAEGEITIRAVRLVEPLELDGALEAAVYGRLDPASGFIQQDPDNGTPATEDTQVWVFYDDRNLYVAVRALDSRPERMVANEMRRDNRNIWLGRWSGKKEEGPVAR